MSFTDFRRFKQADQYKQTSAPRKNATLAILAVGDVNLCYVVYEFHKTLSIEIINICYYYFI